MKVGKLGARIFYISFKILSLQICVKENLKYFKDLEYPTTHMAEIKTYTEITSL